MHLQGVKRSSKNKSKKSLKNSCGIENELYICTR